MLLWVLLKLVIDELHSLTVMKRYIYQLALLQNSRDRFQFLVTP
jgi:hypothetical protein